MSLAIGSVTYADAPGGFQATAGKYWLDDNDDGSEYDVELVRAPGVAGGRRVAHNFNGRKIMCHVCYVAVSATLCRSGFETDRTAFQNQEISVTLDSGAVLPSCEVVKASAMGQPKSTGYGTFLMKAVIEIEQRRQT